MKMILELPSCFSPPPAFLAVAQLIFFPFYMRAIFDTRFAIYPNALPSFELSHEVNRFAFALKNFSLIFLFLRKKIAKHFSYSSIN